MLPTTDAERKALPLWTGVVMYFPDALLAVAAVSKAGNDQHNPGEPLHWQRDKSTDQMNTATRHMLDHALGNRKDEDGTYHLAKAAWRLLAALQLAIEADQPQEAIGPGELRQLRLPDAPRRARGPHYKESGCGMVAPPGHNPIRWCCERISGHFGPHMAWKDQAGQELRAGGEWS